MKKLHTTSSFAGKVAVKSDSPHTVTFCTCNAESGARATLATVLRAPFLLSVRAGQKSVNNTNKNSLETRFESESPPQRSLVSLLLGGLEQRVWKA